MRKIWKFLFSRFTISALIILLSLALIIYLIYILSALSVLILTALTIIDILLIISIINKEANPEYKIPWIVITLIMPLFGGVLYVIFYSRKLTKKESRLLERINNEARVVSDVFYLSTHDEHLNVLKNVHTPAVGKVNSLLLSDPLATLYRGTSSKYFPLGEGMFESMLSDIMGAEKYIFLEYFIIKNGEMWDRLITALKIKANEGVDVRLLYDDVGSRTMPITLVRTLLEYGIKCQRVGRVTPTVSAIHNNRDHRKILAIDGYIAYTGGINIADEYINRESPFGHWKDGGIRVEGHAALGFTKLFLSMWDFTSGGVSDYLPYFSEIRESESADGGYYVPFGSGPSPIYKSSVGKEAIINLINQAGRYIYITTPYLIIDYSLTEALCGAARRGVDIRIITPAIADKKKVKVMTKSSYPHLMSSGVKIYEYTPGFIHEKLIVVDDLYAIIGTINFDFRSLVHHFEDGVWMYNTPTVLDIKEEFLKTQSVSHLIDKAEAELTLYERLVRSLIRLFAPLL